MLFECFLIWHCFVGMRIAFAHKAGYARWSTPQGNVGIGQGNGLKYKDYPELVSNCLLNLLKSRFFQMRSSIEARECASHLVAKSGAQTGAKI